MDERLNMVAPCGLDCGICELYTCKDNQDMINYFISTGIPKENLPCKGCKNIAGKCPVITSECETYKCVESQNLANCSECTKFPCMKLAPAVDKANMLPHNMKVFNLATIKNVGLLEFVNISSVIKQSYFKGIMIIGDGPKTTT